MTNAKMTKREWYAVLTEVVKTSDYADKDGALDFIAHEVELLDRKSSKTSKTKTQKENEVLVEQVLEELSTMPRAVTVSDFQADSEFAATFTNQKLSALLKKLVDTGRVHKEVVGKKSYFSVVAE